MIAYPTIKNTLVLSTQKQKLFRDDVHSTLFFFFEASFTPHKIKHYVIYSFIYKRKKKPLPHNRASKVFLANLSRANANTREIRNRLVPMNKLFIGDNNEDVI